MGTNRIEKQNLVLDGKTLEIFEYKGYRESDQWVTNTTALGRGIMVEANPAPQSENIECVLNEDIKKGLETNIDHLLVHPVIALFLFLEGKIDRTAIINSKTTEDVITFEGVNFNTTKGPKSLRVVAKKNIGFRYATVDKEGNVIE